MKLTISNYYFPALTSAAVGFVLAACSVQPSLPTGTPQEERTSTPTATIVWFPPTDTPTPFPTLVPNPTQNFRPGQGDLIFSDVFDQPPLWDISSSGEASASVTRNRLLLSINSSGPLSILSLRSKPAIGDFYAEVTADISLCAGMDQYGLLFRASPGGNYYRFTINCSGQLRLVRLRDGETYPLTDWIASGDAPSGAPASVKIGVWADGREFRVFLNDTYQASASDPTFSSGTIGFFASASGQTPVTVAFSNLAAYSVTYVIPTPTFNPSLIFLPTPTPTHEE